MLCPEAALAIGADNAGCEVVLEINSDANNAIASQPSTLQFTPLANDLQTSCNRKRTMRLTLARTPAATQQSWR